MVEELMSERKIKVLTFIGYFLPGYRSGGALRSLANLVEHLGDDIEFFIVTRDRDVGDTRPYSGVVQSGWNKLGKANVYYVSPGGLTLRMVRKLIMSQPHDILYLNSFFDFQFTCKPLFVQLFLGRKTDGCRIILAPRGEFSPGALKIKNKKKRLYLRLSKMTGAYNDVVFHASSEIEALDIRRAMDISDENIHIALDLAGKLHTQKLSCLTEDSSVLKIVFLSRIVTIKNLDFALKALARVSAPLAFHIYGPKEDSDYWGQCENLIRRLPTNVTVAYKGIVRPDAVVSVLSQYDLFFLPSRGENYGHVIAESLSAGTPVLISDRTAWKNLERDHLGWVLPLEDMEPFAARIESLAETPVSARRMQRQTILNAIEKRLNDQVTIEANKRLFSDTC